MPLFRRKANSSIRTIQRRRIGSRIRTPFERLEDRHLLAAMPVISEFSASNDSVIDDEDGDDTDWIEILNAGNETAELRGWYLTDDADDLTKWRFPEQSLDVGETLIVFASNKDRATPASQLHTNFRLSASGEYLALVQPDGVTIGTDFSGEYPPQVTDVSYGFPTTTTTTRLVGDGDVARVLIPTDDRVDVSENEIAGSWLDPAFDDRGPGWFDASLGLGYATDAGAADLLADSVADYSLSGEQGENNWFYGYYDRSNDNGRYAAEDFAAFPSSFFTGAVWDWPDGNPPNTLIGQMNMQPNGVNSGDEHWAIRRYISEGAGSLEVSWRVRKSGLAAGGSGVSGRVFHNGELVDSKVLPGDATTWVTSTVVIDGVNIGDAIDFAIDPRGTDLLPLDLQDMSQLAATIYGITGVDGNISDNGDIQSSMQNVGSSAYVRIPFHVDAPSRLNSLELNMRYDDGFIAYLNGQPVAAANGDAPADATFQSTADSDRDTTSTNLVSRYDLTNELDRLNVGENLLMIHGMNVSADNEDFILRPELLSTELELDFDHPRYFVSPTPGAINGLGADDVGPLFLDHRFAPLTVVQTEFVTSDASTRVHIPTNDSLGRSWVTTDFDDANGDWFDAQLGVGYEATAQQPLRQIADSWDDWSVSGTQGEASWYYGYFNETTDTDGGYSIDDFRPFAPDDYVGVVWDWPDNSANTLIGIQNMVTNGTDNGQIHWPVRRYISETTGTLSIDWKLVKSGLAKGGNGVTGRLYHNGVAVDTITLGGLDTNGITRNTSIPNVRAGDMIDFALDPRGSDGQPDGVLDTARLSATIEGPSSIRGLITTDIGDQMRGVSASAYLRMPFNVSTGIDYDSLKLDVHYDDGFVAYLNGQQVAVRNVGEPGHAAIADASRGEIDVKTIETIDLSEYAGLLNDGANMFALQVVNAGVHDQDLVIVPRLYGSGPTDQAPSGTVPNAGDALIVTATISKAFSAVGGVDLNYQIMYGPIETVAMRDDGLENDRLADDGIYTGTIPGGLTDAGEMTRWFITARDDSGIESRLPVFDSPLDSEQFFGTISYDPSVESSNLPILHWFVETPSRANTNAGTRGSLYYDGEFYDNVQFDIHGQSTRGAAFKKKSYDVDFTRDHRFRWSDDTRRMKDINLLTNYADKGNFRNELAYEVWGLAGGATHLAEPVRVQQNGEFYAIYDFVEDGDDRFLERLGLDPEGAFYKMYNNGSTVSGNEKITRRNEDFSDLQAVMDGARLSGQARQEFLFDNIDIPAAVNFLAAQVVNANIDCCHKNYYMYRDTNGTGLWTFLPWDADLSFGRLWTPSQNYFDDIIKIDTGVTPGHMVVTSALYNTPEFREMYMRRVRTLIDKYLQAPGTAADELFFERRLDEILSVLDPTDDDPSTGTDDADLDFQRWGTWGNNYTMRQEIESVKTVFLPERRDFIFNTQTVENGGEIPSSVDYVFTDLTDEEAPVTAWVPTDGNDGTAWTEIGFDDSRWLHGNGGVGYERGNGYQAYIDVDLLNVTPTSARIDTNGDGTNENDSVYVRYPFTFRGSAAENLTLQMQSDDGFVAYLNGTEIARSNFTGRPSWNSRANGNGTEVTGTYRNFDIAADAGLLRQGANVLAIHGLNQGPTSSDMLVRAKLSIAEEVEATVDIDFGQYDANPIGGDQDREFVEIINNDRVAIDVSDWQVVGGIRHSIRPGTVIPAGGSLYLTPSLVAFRERTSGPRGGQGLFVQEGYNGHLSNAGETIELRNAAGAVVASLSTDNELSLPQQFLRVSEIMYRPSDPTPAELEVDPLFYHSDFEFIELMNVSTNTTLDLDGVAITSGIGGDFAFSESAIRSLEPGEHVLVVSNVAAFEARYGTNLPVAGEFAGGLDSDGDSITIDDIDGSTILKAEYDSNGLWPRAADGVGASLEYLDLTPQSDTRLYGKFYQWKSSEIVGGTPGRSATGDTPVVINEILANASRDDEAASEHRDAIELHNTSSTSIDISGWYLSDARASLLKYRIPEGTVLPGGGYVVFDERHFNPTPQTPGPNDFSLSGSRGDDVWLVQAVDGRVARVIDDVDFGPTDVGQTLGLAETNHFGPTATDGYRLTPLTRNTLGCRNSQPLIDDVFISEIHYLPAPPSAEALALYPDLDTKDLEYIVLGARSVGPSIPAGWKIQGAVEIELPADPTGKYIVSFDPEDAANAALAAAFRVHHELPDWAPLLGRYSGGFSSEGEQIALLRPMMLDDDTPDEQRLVLADQVIYDDQHPWPEPAEGDGIVRVASMWLGNDGSHWVHNSDYLAGTSRKPVWGDFNGDDVADADDLQLLIDAVARGSQNVDYVLSGTIPMADASEIDFYLRDVVHSLPGDANVDGVVNAIDLNQVGLNWQRSACGGWSDGDFDGNGLVDAADLNAIGLNWQQAARGRAGRVHSPTAAAKLTPSSAAVRRTPRAPLGDHFLDAIGEAQEQIVDQAIVGLGED